MSTEQTFARLLDYAAKNEGGIAAIDYALAYPAARENGFQILERQLAFMLANDRGAEHLGEVYDDVARLWAEMKPLAVARAEEARKRTYTGWSRHGGGPIQYGDEGED